MKKLPYGGSSNQTTSGFKNLDTLELDGGIALEALGTGTPNLDELHIGETFLELPDNGEASREMASATLGTWKVLQKWIGGGGVNLETLAVGPEGYQDHWC